MKYKKLYIVFALFILTFLCGCSGFGYKNTYENQGFDVVINDYSNNTKRNKNKTEAIPTPTPIPTETPIIIVIPEEEDNTDYTEYSSNEVVYKQYDSGIYYNGKTQLIEYEYTGRFYDLPETSDEESTESDLIGGTFDDEVDSEKRNQEIIDEFCNWLEIDVYQSLDKVTRRVFTNIVDESDNSDGLSVYSELKQIEYKLSSVSYYDSLIKNIIKNNETLVDDWDRLQEYIREWLYDLGMVETTEDYYTYVKVVTNTEKELVNELVTNLKDLGGTNR